MHVVSISTLRYRVPSIVGVLMADRRTNSADGSTLDVPMRAKRWTAADEVHSVLQGLIIGGDFQPGHRLTELALAAQLRISRTPLRHALQRLIAEGWLSRTSTGAIHVVDVSEEEIEALYAVRSALEQMMIAQAAKRMSAEAMIELGSILKRQDEAARTHDARLVSTLGELFHRTLWRLSGNEVGVKFLEEVLQRTTRYRRLSFTAAYRFKEGSSEHWKILSALERGDVDQARHLLQRHVEQSHRYVIEAFSIWRDASEARVGETGQRRQSGRKMRPIAMNHTR
jgi:DNA-binding GntR family transcriptional regulator